MVTWSRKALIYKDFLEDSAKSFCAENELCVMQKGFACANLHIFIFYVIICKNINVNIWRHIMKKCSGCQAVKSLDNFHKDKNSKDGRYNYCKQCVSTRHKKGSLASRGRPSTASLVQDHIAQAKIWASQPMAQTELEEYQETLAEVNKFIIQWKTRLQKLPMELARMDQEHAAELELIKQQKEAELELIKQQKKAELEGAKQELTRNINHYIEQCEQRKAWLENYIAQ